MYRCSVLVPHVDTLDYLKFCVEQIRKYIHPEILQEIVIIDQSKEAIYQEIQKLYSNSPDIRLIHIPKIDHGHAIDTGLQYAQYEYYVSLDCDAFPIHKNWLYVPIKLIEKYNLSFVGTNTGLEISYKNKGQFFHINNNFYVARTALGKEISKAVGFIRPSNRSRAGFIPLDESWGKSDADNGVVAQWYVDQRKLGDKLTLEFTSHAGVSNKMGLFGIVIDDLVFHLVFGYGEDWIRDMNDILGPDYLQLRDKMKSEGLSEELLRKIIANSTKLSRKRRINGQHISLEMDALINELKNA